MNLRTIDIPQADSLATVRQVVEAISRFGNAPVKALVEATNFSERHVRYRLATARALGLVSAIENGTTVTARGVRLLATEPGSAEEKKEFRRAVSACPAVRQIAPDLLSASTVDIKELAGRIARMTGLSPSTAERRAVVFRSWHRDLK